MEVVAEVTVQDLLDRGYVALQGIIGPVLYEITKLYGPKSKNPQAWACSDEVLKRQEIYVMSEGDNTNVSILVDGIEYSFSFEEA